MSTNKMNILYKHVKFDDGLYLTAYVGGELYVSTEKSNEWMQTLLLAATYIVKGDTLIVYVGSDILVVLKKKDRNSSKL
jgi:hypothetical protein